MADDLSCSEAQVAAFEERQSPAGLLVRYARGRIAHFWARQALTLIGALSLVFLESPQMGALVTCLALVGEGVDCAILRQVPRWNRAGRPFAWIHAVTTLSAAFQALTISACVLVTLTISRGSDPSFFAFAFLTGAAINAGVVLPFHPLAGKARLAIYMLTGAVYLLADMIMADGLMPHHGYEVMAALLMAYTARVFLDMVIRGRRSHVQFSRDLLAGARALAQSNHDLNDSQREARQLALVARHANDSVILTNRYGRILWVNDAFEKMTGYPLAEVEGRETGALLNGPDTCRETVEAIRLAMRQARPVRTEILNYTRDGRKIWVETNLVPICDADGKTEMVIGIERDVTSAKAHAAELTRATLRAEEGARAKAVFLATMSHEIRTPMNGIIGMSDLLSETALGPQQREYVSAINTSAEALLRIINDILDYSRLDADKMVTAEEPFNLGRCIRLSTDLLRGSARDKGLFLDICHEDALPETLVGDEGRVRQVLLNLLGNAIKFTETGGVTVRVGARRTGTDCAIRISVADTGIGVPQDRAERIFEQFEQADVAITRKYGGTGLGLAISRKLARRMGGDLVFEPGSSAGSVFVFTFKTHLRHAPATAPAPVAAVMTTAPDRRDLSGARILVAEDNRTNSLLIARYLGDLDVTLWFAATGVEVLEMVRQHAPDIVLMDVSMPEMDGITATVRIRQDSGAQPYIIALTANAHESDRDRCLEAGMNDFLPKPIRKADLIAALARSSRTHKPLGSAPMTGVSPDEENSEAPHWTSQPASGTTSGRSIRSSGP